MHEGKHPQLKGVFVRLRSSRHLKAGRDKRGNFKSEIPVGGPRGHLLILSLVYFNAHVRESDRETAAQA